jgi:hypothetical protein
MLHSFRDNSVPESGICCNLPGRSCKDKGVCAVFFKLVGRLASNVSACLVRYSEGICSTLTNIMARDNLRVSAAATRELLPTQAGTFDGRFGVSCDNAINPLKLLQRNETTGLYDVVRTVTEEEYDAHRESLENSKKRRLSFQSHVVAPLYTNGITVSSRTDSSSSSASSLSSSLLVSTRRQLQNTPLFLDDDPDALLLARECLCAPVADASISTFCPVGQDNCRIALPNGYRAQLELTCTTEPQDFFVRYVLPLTVFMFVFFGCLCFCSPKGRSAVGYMKKIIHCCDEDWYEQSLNDTLDRMVQQQFDRRMRLERARAYQDTTGRIFIPSAQNVLPGIGMPTLQREIAHRSIVVLKTMKYRGNTRQEVSEDQEEELCAICLNAFQEGDRVGNVKCGHIFHATCLKTWIQRKNHCPLCQMDDMATPQGGNNDDDQPTRPPQVSS